MAAIPQPFEIGKSPPFLGIDTGKIPQLIEYVQWQLTDGEFLNQSSCELGEHAWVETDLIDTNGALITKMFICAGDELENVPTRVTVNSIGFVSIAELRELSFDEKAMQVITAALRTASVMGAIAAGLNIAGIQSGITSLNDSISGVIGKVNEQIKPIYSAIQKTTAWIEKTFHADLLKRLHKLGQVISPEYKSTVRSYENSLAETSDKIFGNTSTLTVYMKFYEMMMIQRIKSSKTKLRETKDIIGKTPDELSALYLLEDEQARVEALQKSYDRSKEIRTKIDTYESNPMSVWSDIYAFTFADMNKYIDEDRLFRDKAIIEMLGKLADVTEKVNDTALNIGKFAKILEVDLLKLDNPDLFKLSKTLSNFYDDSIAPAVRTIQSENKRLEKEIKAVETEREKEKHDRERSKLMSSPKSELNIDGLKNQGNHFRNLYNEHVEPLEAVSPTPLHDIEKAVEAIFNQ